MGFPKSVSATEMQNTATIATETPKIVQLISSYRRGTLATRYIITIVNSEGEEYRRSADDAVTIEAHSVPEHSYAAVSVPTRDRLPRYAVKVLWGRSRAFANASNP